MLKTLLQKRAVKFLIGGGMAAAFNLLLIHAMIDWLDFSSPFLRNIANALSIELSLVLSFFIYRIWVWPGGSWSFTQVLVRQLPLYHVSAGSAVLLRILVIFPLLDWLGVNYAINTLVGVLASSILNYVIADRLVFKESSAVDFSRPEGLSTVLEASPSEWRTAKPYSGEFRLSLVIPAHNEEECIADTVKGIVCALEAQGISYEILVINDNSKDRTEECLKSLSAENHHVRYLNNTYPNGFGFAIRCGLENFDGDAVAIVMADASDAPENIVDYYRQLRLGYDCVFGSRFVKDGAVYDYPGYKLAVNRLANLFIQVLFGLKFNDTTNAFKAYRREVIAGISPLISHHFNLTVELPLKAMVRGYSYSVIPITWRNRKAGVSKLKLKEMGSRYLFIVLSILLEKYLSRGDYVRRNTLQPTLRRAR
ncbi:MAG: glycosyltransferase [Gemmatimonadaceae bacterium]|nr:glycosyltransferase [Gloeobacterales cyanobacterium ES-bin-141]